jgi:hypothetical protein
VAPTVDTTAPTLSITSNVAALKVGETATITFTFSEAPTGFVDGDITTTGGTLGSISGSGLTRTATFTPTAGLASGNASITVTSGAYTDTAGNSGGAGTTPTISIDTTAPTVASVAISSATNSQNSTLNAGDVVSVTVTMSEATTVVTSGGTPQLALVIGGTTVQAAYASGSGGAALVFTYTVLAGQTDANGISIAANSLALNGGTLSDAAGNAATLTHALVADNAGYLVDTTAPTVTNTSGAYTSSTDTLVLTGTNYNTLLETSESATTDIKALLDWSKLLWDINGDNATTADVSFELSDISSAQVTDSTHLSIVLTSAKGLSLEATSGYGGATLDTLDITAGFAKDTSGNAATTDAVVNGGLFHTGQSVIDLGSYGKLIAPVQVEGAWYYYWDSSGDGTSNSADQRSQGWLDGIFTSTHATLNGVMVALPTANGGAGYPQGNFKSQNGTSYEDAGASTNGTTSSFNELLAIWDAYNGTGTGTGLNGTPPGWRDDYYWVADVQWGHDAVRLRDADIDAYTVIDNFNFHIALQVL